MGHPRDATYRQPANANVAAVTLVPGATIKVVLLIVELVFTSDGLAVKRAADESNCVHRIATGPWLIQLELRKNEALARRPGLHSGVPDATAPCFGLYDAGCRTLSLARLFVGLYSLLERLLQWCAEY